MFDRNINEGQENTKEVRCIFQVVIWTVQGLSQHVTKTWGPRPSLGWDSVGFCVYWCALACVRVIHVCMLAACVHVSGDPGTCWWRNQVRERSRVHKLPSNPRSLSHQSVILAAGHHTMPTVWLEMCLSVCLSLVRSLTPTENQFQNHAPPPFLFFTFLLASWSEGVCVCTVMTIS